MSEVQFLVDSGATYTLLPERVWKAIELTPKRKATFTFQYLLHVADRLESGGEV